MKRISFLSCENLAPFKHKRVHVVFCFQQRQKTFQTFTASAFGGIPLAHWYRSHNDMINVHCSHGINDFATQ